MKNTSHISTASPESENNNISLDLVKNLNPNLLKSLEKGILSVSSALELAKLDVEQEWVYKYYIKNKILPSIKSARQIREFYDKRKLTLAELNRIMERQQALKPQKIVFERKELLPYFQDDITDDEIKNAVLKIVGFWKNRRS